MTASSLIVLESVAPVARSELTEPFAREISRLYETPVKERQFEHEPAAAGFSEIAIYLAVAGPLVYKFFEPLITAAGEAFRDKMLELLKNARKSPTGDRIYVPLLIQLGADTDKWQSHTPIRYFFYGRMDAQELLKRLKAAEEHARSLPPELYAGMGGPTENGFYWDRVEERWRGNVWGQGGQGSAYGEFWIEADRWDVGFEDDD